MFWSYRTTKRTSTKETPFSLAFSIEAVIPLEIGISSFYTAAYDEIENKKALRRDLDLVEERKNGAELRNTTYKQCNTKYYDLKVRKWASKVRSLVLRRVFLATREIELGSLGPN